MNISEVIKQYFEMNEQVKQLEKALKELKPQIELHIAKETNTLKLIDSVTMAIGDYIATLTPASRESFNLKEAKKVIMTEELSPFLSVSSYTTLKVNKVFK